GIKGLSRWVAIAAIVFSIAVIAFGFAPSFWIAASLLYVVGFATMIQFGSTNTLIQMMSPDRLRGRAISAYSMMYMGMAPIGSVPAGFIADHVGARITIGAGGIICLIASAVYASQVAEIRLEAHKMVAIASPPPPDPVGAPPAPQLQAEK